MGSARRPAGGGVVKGPTGMLYLLAAIGIIAYGETFGHDAVFWTVAVVYLVLAIFGDRK